MKTCEIDGCEKPLRTAAADWCNMHYTRWWRHGDPQAVVEQEDRARRRPSATDPADVRRLEEHCELHVTRQDGTVHVILYDHADAETVEGYRWSLSESNSVPELFYARTSSKLLRTSMHILLTGRTLVDHINRNGLDNRRNNLRPATKSQNSANQRPRSNGTSQYKGVFLKKTTGRWGTRIKADGRSVHLGYFADEIEAAKTYDRAALEAFGEFAYLNFPEAS